MTDALRDAEAAARWLVVSDAQSYPGFGALLDAYRDAIEKRVREERDAVVTPALLGGWRELIAMLDDMQKDEAVAQAMWVALDQIDRAKAALHPLEENTMTGSVEAARLALTDAILALRNAPLGVKEAITIGHASNHLEAEIRAEERNRLLNPSDDLVEAARAVLADWDAATPGLKSVTFAAHLHGVPYVGPTTLGDRMEALRTALQAAGSALDVRVPR
jgi:hypothetical protein